VTLGGYWHHIDLSGTAFTNTDIDTVEFVFVAQTGAAMNYLAVGNFIFTNFGLPVQPRMDTDKNRGQGGFDRG